MGVEGEGIVDGVRLYSFEVVDLEHEYPLFLLLFAEVDDLGA